ncbi:efflux RND transporter periplasmic adaptor subunit [Catenovulum sediminis]|uniref:Efflux RND transporter periplasmic adaptor subunit n=1 Tax=Catenovulum sediminis TaxID=1740262 RepID=A0ABV1RN32_9ALTE
MTRSSLYFAFLFVTSALVTACSEPAKPTAPQQQAQAVDIIEVESTTAVFSETIPAKAVAAKIAEVRPQVSGIIIKRNFVEGSQVKQGDTLYQIDDALFVANLASAKAQLRSTQAQLKNASAELERFKTLVSSKSVSQQQLDQAQANVDSLQAEIGIRQAQLKRTQTELEYSKVKAPIGGIIGKSKFTEGALVTAGQAAALTTITQLDPIYFDAAINSKNLLTIQKRIKSGELLQMQAPVSLLQGEQILRDDGHFLFNEVQVDAGTDSLILRTEFSNPDHFLLPGLFARVKLNFAQRKNSIMVPQKAIMFNAAGKASVYTVNAENKVELKQITLDQAFAKNWLVLEGLSAGDKVIVSGLQKIAPGVTVQVAE